MLTGAVAPSRGVMPEPIVAWATARVTFSQYEIGQFDLAWADAGTLNDLIGDPNSSLNSVIAPTASGIICGILGIWQQSVSAGQRGRIMLVGESYAKVIKASGNVARSDRLCATTAKNLSPDHSAGDRVIAVAREPLTAPAAATNGLVLFNGITGLAQFVT